MQGIEPGKMQRLIVALQKLDALGGVSGNKMDVLSMLHKMLLPPDDIELISRFFTFPGQDVVMTDANCIKLKLFMAIGMMNRIFNAHFKFILRGGFAVRMNILKKMQTVDSFTATKDMDDLIATVSNADLDCLVMPVHGNELSAEDQSELIRLLQMSIENTAESFRVQHMESNKAHLSKMAEFRKKELEDTQKKIQQHMSWISGISDEDEDGQARKNDLMTKLQTLQERMKVSAVAKPDEFGLTIRPATNSALTTKINWKTSGSQTELMDVTVMPVHDASSLYADISRMKQIRSNYAVWYYPGQYILFIEYLDVMHEVTQQLSSDPEMPPADKELQLKMQSKKMDKFKSRAKICYGLLNEEERVNLISSLPQNLMGELRRMMQAGGAKKRTRRTKKCTRRNKKRNGRKIRNSRKNHQ
jgi:hypothetical protein